MQRSRSVLAVVALAVGVVSAPAAQAQPVSSPVWPVQLGPATYLERGAPAARSEAAITAAMTKLGAPYVYGAAGPDSFDCSGLTQWAFRQAGLVIPRTTGDQAAGGIAVPLDQMRRGDLVFSYTPISHVGFYLGDGTVLHSPTTGDKVKISPLRYLDPVLARRY